MPGYNYSINTRGAFECRYCRSIVELQEGFYWDNTGEANGGKSQRICVACKERKAGQEVQSQPATKDSTSSAPKGPGIFDKVQSVHLDELSALKERVAALEASLSKLGKAIESRFLQAESKITALEDNTPF